MFTNLYFAAGDLFSMGNSAVTKFGHLLGAALVLFIGIKAAGHVARDSPLAAIAVVLVALIPAFFIFDPTGAVNFMKSTVSGL